MHNRLGSFLTFLIVYKRGPLKSMPHNQHSLTADKLVGSTTDNPFLMIPLPLSVYVGCIIQRRIIVAVDIDLSHMIMIGRDVSLDQ